MTYRELEREMANAYRGYTYIEYTSKGPSFKGIPFAVVPGKQNHFIQLLDFVKNLPADKRGSSTIQIHQGNYKSELQPKIKPYE